MRRKTEISAPFSSSDIILVLCFIKYYELYCHLTVLINVGLAPITSPPLNHYFFKFLQKMFYL